MGTAFSFPEFAAVPDLIEKLCLPRVTARAAPTLEPAERALAFDWLRRAVLDREARHSHLQQLAKYKTPGHSEPELLPTERAEAIAERGLEAELTDDELIHVLTRPAALCDLADVVELAQSDAWAEAMDEVGGAIMARDGVALEYDRRSPELKELLEPEAELAMRSDRRGPVGEVKKTEGGSVTFRIGDDEEGRKLARWLGEECYGDPEQAVTFRLHAVPSGEAGKLHPQLEMEPAPTKAALVVAMRFPSGEMRELTVAKAAVRKPKARSSLVEVLEEAEFTFAGVEFGEPGWPLTMTMG